MTPGIGFISFLAVTLSLLGGVVWTGYAEGRRLHITLVVSAVASLGVTIYFAEKLGDLYDLEGAGWIYPVHLTIAKLCTAAYLLPVVTGLLTIRKASNLRLHRVAAFTVLAFTVLTAITGTWMLLASERLDGPGAWADEVRASERATSNPR